MKRKIFIAALFAAGVGINPWVVGRFLTTDGHLNSLPSIVLIVLLELVLAGWGTLEALVWKEKITARTKTFVFLICGLSLLPMFVFFEVFVRMNPQFWIPRRFMDLQNSWDKKDSFLPDFFQVSKVGFQYRDYFLISRGAMTTAHINFSADDALASRRTPNSVPVDTADCVIWMFGGSTTEDAGTSDEYSIANQLALQLNKKKKTAVYNFGTASFQSSLESVKYFDLLRRTQPSNHPDVVLFYDGFNDSMYSFAFGPGNIQKDISEKLALLVEGRYPKLIFYSSIKFISQWVHSFRPIEIFFLNRMFSKEIYDFSEPNIQKGVKVYLDNMKMIRAVSREFHVRPIFVLQPLVTSKKGVTPFENEVLADLPQGLPDASRSFYEAVRQSNSSDFYDLSMIFDNNGRDDFLDYGHTGPLSGIDVGNALARLISHK